MIYNNMNNIAIIPARSGSKGLKNKNIKMLCGKPLMAYSVEAALNSGMFDVVMVSTDSEEYAQIAKESGAEVPFLRSEQTSSDVASSWDVVSEVLNNYKKAGKSFDTFSLLQPTSPLRTESDIQKAYAEMIRKAANAIISVCEVDHSPLLSNVLPDNLSLTNFIKSENQKRRQELEKYYRLNGAIYISRVDYFQLDSNIYRDNCYAYIMDKRCSIDIDDEFDFMIAEAIIKSKDV